MLHKTKINTSLRAYPDTIGGIGHGKCEGMTKPVQLDHPRLNDSVGQAGNLVFVNCVLFHEIARPTNASRTGFTPLHKPTLQFAITVSFRPSSLNNIH